MSRDTTKRQRRLRKFWQSDPKPAPGNLPPGPDPGRELLTRAASEGLITDADAATLDAWAEDLAKRFCRGEFTAAEAQRMITERAAADASRRGKA